MTSDYTLAYGTHPNPQDGRCAMEWVAHLAGERHSDQPACVSPVVRAAVRRAQRWPRLHRAPAPAPVSDAHDRHRRGRPRRNPRVDGARLADRRLRADLVATRRAPRRGGAARRARLIVVRDSARSPRARVAGAQPAARSRSRARRSSATSSTGRWRSRAARPARSRPGRSPPPAPGTPRGWGSTNPAAERAAPRSRRSPATARRSPPGVRVATRRARRSLGGRPSAALLLRPVTTELAESAIGLLDRMLPTIPIPALIEPAAEPLLI